MLYPVESWSHCCCNYVLTLILQPLSTIVCLYLQSCRPRNPTPCHYRYCHMNKTQDIIYQTHQEIDPSQPERPPPHHDLKSTGRRFHVAWENTADADSPFRASRER